MKRFAMKGLLFSLPFSLYVLFIFFADPFNFLNAPSPISEDVKFHTSFQLNPCFWKMNQFERDPYANILLGDSRMMALHASQLKEATGEDYYNFSYGGASLREIIDTFWFAAKRTPLRKVYIGLNLTVYNDYNYTERTKTYPTIAQSPALYFVNRTVLQSALYGAYSQLSHADLKLGVPTLDREAFWQYVVRDVDSAYYKSYVYPTKYKQELIKIAQYCRDHAIQLSFIIFPTHVDVQQLVGEYHLEQANEMFRRDLAGLAPVYDFDYKNDITERKENFSDPDHTVRPITEVIIREVWLNQLQYGQKYQ